MLPGKRATEAIANKAVQPPRDVKGGTTTFILTKLATTYLDAKDRVQAMRDETTKRLLGDMVCTDQPLAKLREKTILNFDNILVSRMQRIDNDMALMSKSKEAQQLETRAVSVVRQDINDFRTAYDKYIKLVEQAFSEAETKLKQVGQGDKSPKSKVPLAELERRIKELNKAFQDDVQRNYTENVTLLQRLGVVEKEVLRLGVAFKETNKITGPSTTARLE